MIYTFKIPKYIQISFNNQNLKIIGKLGEINMQIPKELSLKYSNNILEIYSSDTKLNGTFNSLLKKNLKGVSQGFIIKLQLVGIGFKFLEANSFLKLKLGYSHKVYCKIPENITVKIIKPTLISLSSINYFELNQFAGKLKSFKTPDVYGGKGIRTFLSFIKLKVVKKK